MPFNPDLGSLTDNFSHVQGGDAEVEFGDSGNDGFHALTASHVEYVSLMIYESMKYIYIDE